jgi:hypothetical protein
VTFKAANEGRFTMLEEKKSGQKRPKRKPERRVRVRSKSLAEIDETKLALALWLMAKRQLEEQEAEQATSEPQKVA